ncbi:MAG: heparinase, partial [Alphaproteobacteria bacterium]|nr:heparinase [Alphaproteobacteria bacterium]
MADGDTMMRGRLAALRRLPPEAVAKRAIGLVRRKSGAAIGRIIDGRRSTYSADAPEGDLQPLLGVLPLPPIAAARAWIAPAAALYCRHFFDLLGSGWVRVGYGMACAGFDGVRYGPAGAVTPDRDGAWLAAALAPAAVPKSRSIWRLVDEGYAPIDWQLDIRSGFRWRQDQWAADAPIGHLPGVDVKVPWELARAQHLPILAWAYALATRGEGGFEPAARYLGEFRNQVLDFIASNPPRFGINWRCTMDVAIRAANWVMAHDLFRAFGAAFDQPFTAALKGSLVDHGRHIVSNLEFYPEGRGNHYLADICGLAFIAACLPRNAEGDAWLAFAAQELCAEAEHQFGADGAGFEGSTSYHRLSAEMTLFTTALIEGLPEDRRAGIREADPALLRTRPRRRLATPRRLPDEAHLARIAAMAAFSRAVTKPSGRIAQIGDNDSGRFFKLHPILAPRPPAEARLIYGNLDRYDGL